MYTQKLEVLKVVGHQNASKVSKKVKLGKNLDIKLLKKIWNGWLERYSRRMRPCLFALGRVLIWVCCQISSLSIYFVVLKVLKLW